MRYQFKFTAIQLYVVPDPQLNYLAIKPLLRLAFVLVITGSVVLFVHNVLVMVVQVDEQRVRNAHRLVAGHQTPKDTRAPPLDGLRVRRLEHVAQAIAAAGIRGFRSAATLLVWRLAAGFLSRRRRQIIFVVQIIDARVGVLVQMDLVVRRPGSRDFG